MTEREVYRKILETSDIYDEYKTEREEYLFLKGKGESFDNVFNNTASEWIVRAFAFAYTKKQIDYWDDISTEWKDFVENGNDTFIEKHAGYTPSAVNFALQAINYKYGIGYNIPKTDDEYENVLKHCSFYGKLMKRYDECFVSFSKIFRDYWVDRVTAVGDVYWGEINKAWKTFCNAIVNDDPNCTLHPFYPIREYYNPEHDYSNDFKELESKEVKSEYKIPKTKKDYIEIITHCNFFPELAKEIESSSDKVWKGELNKIEIGYWICGLFTWEDTDKWSPINNAWLRFCKHETHDIEILKDYYNPKHDYSKDFKGLETKELKGYKKPKTKEDYIEIIKHCSFFPELNAEFINVKKPKSLCDYLKKISTCLFIDNPITWGCTAKGSVYWSDIDKKWNSFCESAESHDAKSEDAFAFIKEYYDPDHDYSKDTKDMETTELKSGYKIPETQEDFIEILKHCSFYPAMVKECHKQNDGQLIDRLLYTDKYDFISDAFTWHDTNQGNEYWSDIDAKWIEFCDHATSLNINPKDVFSHIKDYYNPDYDYSNDVTAETSGKVAESHGLEQTEGSQASPSKDFKVTARRPKMNKLNFKL